MPCLGKTNRETMRNYRKNTMINKKIVKTALKILLLAAGIASCVAAVVDSSRRAKEGEDETPATAIKSYSHTKQSLGGGRATYASPSLPSSAAAVRVSATPHTSVSRTATPVAASGSLYAVAKRQRLELCVEHHRAPLAVVGYHRQHRRNLRVPPRRQAK